MAPSAPRPKNPTGRPRGRPRGSTNAARAAKRAAEEAAAAAGLQPKKRRYIPGGPGGGGRFVDADSVPTPTSNPSRTRGAGRDASYVISSPILPRRERSTRTRSSAAEDLEEWGSAAAITASVKQAEDYKPREERSWEEFHPNLDIEQPFVVFSADEVDGILPEPPTTPSAQGPSDMAHGALTPAKNTNIASTGNTPAPSTQNDQSQPDSQPMTPSGRPRRQIRESVTFYGIRPLALNGTPRTPRILPIQHQTPKEKLDLKLPSFRKTNRIEKFEKEKSDQARYVDKAMSNVGYQESDEFLREDSTLIRAVDANIEEEAEASPPKADDHSHHSRLGRVEYDMDEQDDMWLQQYNRLRKEDGLEEITREVFEITLTKIEKEWHALERRIPKPNPKPPQTHRPRSSSAAAVNGEPPQAGDEPDSRCVICDDGDCENTNAIVFCDGCNLAVHQECYGVPFIPEGQWLCRKCQLCGRGVPTCIFCPNTDGAFKQTNSSKWAHLLCAMWIPEVSLGNHTFMEPVMDVEKVPRTRWKLTCYICRQRMGACIQCSNKNCYQAFHVTCARRSRLYLKMKTSHGALAVLDGSMILKAFCDKHCPPDYTVENNIPQAIRSAKKFYKRNMRGRIWAQNHSDAALLAAQHRIAITEHPSNGSQISSSKNSSLEKEQVPKNLWKLPSGAPIIPQTVFDIVEASIQRFPFRKRKDYLGEACRYWTLKREARRGAALLKRLQLQMETFSSMELTRRDFAAMGPNGKTRLARRIEFAEKILEDLDRLKSLATEIVTREEMRLDAAEVEQDFVDECYFPIVRLLSQAIQKAISLDKELFEKGLAAVEKRVDDRYYATALPFAQELGNIISAGILKPPKSANTDADDADDRTSPSKSAFNDIRERRKLGKRILKATQPFLENALRIESEISNKVYESLVQELEVIIENSLDVTQKADDGVQSVNGEDTIMVDAPLSSNTTAARATNGTHADDDAMDVTEEGKHLDDGEDSIDVKTTPSQGRDKPGNGRRQTRSARASETPPESDEFTSSMGRVEQTGPPTPPQSNGSFGKELADPLTEGGLLWYLKAYDLKGTSAASISNDQENVDADWVVSGDASGVDEAEGCQPDTSKPDRSNTSPTKSKTPKVQHKRRTSARIR